METTKRVEIYTGFACNVRCTFCYYTEHKSIDEFPIERLKKELQLGREYGALDVDFTGGEPTIRRDLPELLSFARDLGYRDICIISNGQMLANHSYVEHLAKSGLNDVLLSIHGLNETYERLTQVRGSFKKITQAADNVNALGIKLRTNTTVVKPNFKELPEIASYLLNLKPEAVNFIMFNPWYSPESQKEEMTSTYSNSAPYLRQSIDKLSQVIRRITVRYIPYCFMEGYEKYVCNFPHRRYDPDEWSHATRFRIESRFWPGLLLWRMVHNGVGPKLTLNLDEQIDHVVVGSVQRSLHVKGKACKVCRYVRICDGFKKGYAHLYGLGEISPVKGKEIRDFMFSRGSYLNSEKP